MALPEEPYTRVEQYLARLAGQNVDIPDYPITRIECYLDYLVNNGGGAAAPNAGAHNAIFRGQSLGNALTDAQVEAISSGTFENIFVGDYWEIGGFKYRVAGLDSFLTFGDTSTVAHHVTIVPDGFMLAGALMNDSPTTEGGYLNCKLRTDVLPTLQATIEGAFGSDNVLVRRTRLTSSVIDGLPNASTWVSSKVELLTESMVIGRGAFGTHNANGFNVGEKACQLPLFSLEPKYVNIGRRSYWLQDVMSAASFAYISSYGLAFYASANNSGSIGVRPFFCLGRAS